MESLYLRSCGQKLNGIMVWEVLVAQPGSESDAGSLQLRTLMVGIFFSCHALQCCKLWASSLLAGGLVQDETSLCVRTLIGTIATAMGFKRYIQDIGLIIPPISCVLFSVTAAELQKIAPLTTHGAG